MMKFSPITSIIFISVVHRSTPRLNCDIKLEHFTVSYTERQHKIIQSIVHEMDRNNRSWKHRHKRPRCSVRKDPRYRNEAKNANMLVLVV